jgi:uncharacterized HAD superfamily protein
MKKGIKTILIAIVGMVFGIIINSYFKEKIISKNIERVNKFKSYYNILNQWITLQHKGKKIEQYFIMNNYNKIAIYGMGEIGKRIYEELNNTSIEVRYSIDKNAESTNSELEVRSLNDELEEVDAIIVTTAFAYDEIKNSLVQKVNCPIISIEDVVFEL